MASRWADCGEFGEFWIWVELGERWSILQWDRGRSFGADKVWDMWGFYGAPCLASVLDYGPICV